MEVNIAYLKHKLSVRVEMAVKEMVKKDNHQSLIKLELNMIEFYLDALK